MAPASTVSAPPARAIAHNRDHSAGVRRRPTERSRAGSPNRANPLTMSSRPTSGAPSLRPLEHPPKLGPVGGVEAGEEIAEGLGAIVHADEDLTHARRRVLLARLQRAIGVGASVPLALEAVL